MAFLALLAVKAVQPCDRKDCEYTVNLAPSLPFASSEGARPMLRLPRHTVSDATAAMWGACKVLFVCELAAVVIISGWDTFGLYMPYAGPISGPFSAGTTAVVVILAAAAYLLTSSRRILPRRLLTKIADRLEAGDRLGAMELCAINERPLARIAFEGLARARDGRAFALDAIDAATFKERLLARRFINAIAIIARVAPLVGMACCVFRMTDVFRQLMLPRGCFGPSPADAYLQGLSQIGAWLVVYLLAWTAVRLLGPRAHRRLDETRAVARALVDYAAEDAGHARAAAHPSSEQPFRNPD